LRKTLPCPSEDFGQSGRANATRRDTRMAKARRKQRHKARRTDPTAVTPMRELELAGRYARAGEDAGKD
jgi:hypothetical protein